MYCRERKKWGRYCKETRTGKGIVERGGQGKVL